MTYEAITRSLSFESTRPAFQNYHFSHTKPRYLLNLDLEIANMFSTHED